MKTCSRCKNTLEESYFYAAKHTADKLQGWCKECSKNRVRQYAQDNPDLMKGHWRKARLKHRYGITEDQYVQLVEKQGNQCAICGAKPQQRPLSVDHDHANGTVRGLLCQSCNIGIGHFNDDPGKLQAAIEYLC